MTSDELVRQLRRSMIVPVDALADLAIEHWRLTRWLEKAGSASPPPSLRQASRVIGRFLEKARMEAIDYEGQPYDPGLAIEVLDRTGPADGPTYVSEMVSPVVLWQKAVLRPGKAFLTGKSQASTEHSEG